jgi:hypothetical protein
MQWQLAVSVLWNAHGMMLGSWSSFWVARGGCMLKCTKRLHDHTSDPRLQGCCGCSRALRANRFNRRDTGSIRRWNKGESGQAKHSTPDSTPIWIPAPQYAAVPKVLIVALFVVCKVKGQLIAAVFYLTFSRTSR